MPHICISKLTIIGSDNGLSLGRRQAIIWTNVGILLTEPLGTNFIEIVIKIHTFSFKKMRVKMSSGKCGPSCLCLKVSILQLHLLGANGLVPTLPGAVHLPLTGTGEGTSRWGPYWSGVVNCYLARVVSFTYYSPLSLSSPPPPPPPPPHHHPTHHHHNTPTPHPPPPLQQSWKGVYWYHLVRLSICGQNCVHSVSSTILNGSISYLHILSSNLRRCVVCNAHFKI